jgi:predicted  nucleic acid-binding Zn-ribbon protein
LSYTVLEVIVKEQMALLVKVQEQDQILDQLRRQIREGPLRIKEVEGQLDTLEGNLEASKNEIREIQKRQRQFEAEVEDGAGRVGKSKSRLLTIKSNKEYQAVLKEIEDIQRTNAEKEDRILSCMEEIEGLNQALQQKEKELLAVRDKFEKEKRTVEAEVRQAEGEVCEVEKHRRDTAKAMDPELLARYEQIKARTGGQAVAYVENTTCSGCHLNIPPQMYNELQRRDSLKFCPNCDRIIYWKDGATALEGDMSE